MAEGLQAASTSLPALLALIRALSAKVEVTRFCPLARSVHWLALHRSVAFADVNADGLLDVAFGNGGTNELYYGARAFEYAEVSGESMSSGATHYITGWQEDSSTNDQFALGLPEQYKCSQCHHLGFHAANNERGVHGHPAAVGDVTGDGWPDLLYGGRLYVNRGDGIFEVATEACTYPAIPRVNPVLLSDVDGDGDLDYIGTDLVVYYNNGTGCFSREVQYVTAAASGTTWSAPQVAEFVDYPWRPNILGYRPDAPAPHGDTVGDTPTVESWARSLSCYVAFGTLMRRVDLLAASRPLPPFTPPPSPLLLIL